MGSSSLILNFVPRSEEVFPAQLNFKETVFTLLYFILYLLYLFTLLFFSFYYRKAELDSILTISEELGENLASNAEAEFRLR